MAQPRLSDASVQNLLTVGPFLGIDATTSKYFLDQYHANDSIAVVPNRAFQGYVTARGRVHAFNGNFASQLFGLYKYQRSGLADIYIAACNSGGTGVLQQAALGGAPTNLTLPTGITLAQSLETSFVAYQQWLFETNGSSTPLKVDTNLTVSQWQMAAPAAAPTTGQFGNPPSASLSLVAGTSNGLQTYVIVTYVAANGAEGTYNLTVNSATPSAVQQVQVASPPAATGAVKYNVYTSTSANGPFYQRNPFAVALGTPFTVPGTVATGTENQAKVWSGNLFGGYYYLVTFANGSQESSPSAVSSAVYVANTSNNPGAPYTPGPVLLSNVPTSTDPQVTGRNIYRFGGTMQEILLVGTINDNTTTTFVDNVGDASVTGQALIQHRDPPQSFYAIEAHKGRVWGFGYSGTAVGEPASIQGSSDLWFSNFEEPWGFNSVTQIIPIGRNAGGDVAVEVKSVGSMLCCLKSKSFWTVLGDTPQDLIARKLAPIGCGSKKSVVSAYGRLFFLSDEGAVYMFDGASFTNISDNRATGANSSIKGILDGFTPADFAAASGAAHDNTYLCSFPTQNITFMYDIPTGQWFKLPWAFDRATFDLEKPNEVTASEVSSGTIDSWFSAETDLGSAITSSYVSRTTDSGQPQATKRYRYLNILAPTQAGVSTTTTLTVNPGNNQKTVTRTHDLGSGSVSHFVSLPPTVGQECQLTLAVTSSARTEIHRASVYGWIERQFIEAG